MGRPPSQPLQRCSSCNAEILWIRLSSGRSMPCDPQRASVVTLEGTIISGYGSHFATCPNAAQHRKKSGVAGNTDGATSAKTV